jgi:peptidylprolyl isomerase
MDLGFFSHFNHDAVGQAHRRRGVAEMTFRTTLVGLSFLAIWGCAPPDIVPATPPGVELPKPEVAEGDQAEALGESVGRVQAQPAQPAQSTQATNAPATAPLLASSEETTTPSGLKYQTVKPGTGAVAAAGQSVTVHYVGTLTSGQEFDSSRRKGTPFSFKLGSRGVIAGWDEGVAGMKVGELRKLIIPPELGYGARGQGPIPANSTLLFEVELIGVQ